MFRNDDSFLNGSRYSTNRILSRACSREEINPYFGRYRAVTWAVSVVSTPVILTTAKTAQVNYNGDEQDQ
jgi:hypothetical protein